MNRILIIEDDLSLGLSVTTYLKAINYSVMWAKNGKEAFRMFHAGNIDMCLVDIGMPDKDGYEIVKDIRELNRDIPVIFLTARNQIHDKIAAFELGADDYICKPFLVKELELRMQAVRKRFAQAAEADPLASHIVNIGRFSFNFLVRTLTIDGNKVKLSHIDCELLKLLYINRNTFVKTEVILRALWDEEGPGPAKRLSVYLNRLRKMLKEDESVIIENVYGKGYKLSFQMQ